MNSFHFGKGSTAVRAKNAHTEIAVKGQTTMPWQELKWTGGLLGGQMILVRFEDGKLLDPVIYTGSSLSQRKALGLLFTHFMVLMKPQAA